MNLQQVRKIYLITSEALGSGASQVVAGLAKYTRRSRLVSKRHLELLGAGATRACKAGVGSMADSAYGWNKTALQMEVEIYLQEHKSLNSGLGTLSAGAAQVSAGSASFKYEYEDSKCRSTDCCKWIWSACKQVHLKLDSGAGALSTGLNTLQSNIAPLISGVEKLDSGAAELNSGMIQFNEEGIKKLVSVFDGDIDELLNKANELLDASKEYKNFSGIADGMDGSVKFIFVSEK